MFYYYGFRRADKRRVCGVIKLFRSVSSMLERKRKREEGGSERQRDRERTGSERLLKHWSRILACSSNIYISVHRAFSWWITDLTRGSRKNRQSREPLERISWSHETSVADPNILLTQTRVSTRKIRENLVCALRWSLIIANKLLWRCKRFFIEANSLATHKSLPIIDAR